MLRLAGYDIVFQEIPGEVTLALNISECPNKCPGCHSPHLQQDIGEELSDELLQHLLDRYGTSVTCICFMGGDAEPTEVERLALLAKKKNLKTGWYSGQATLPDGFRIEVLDYIKLGPYSAELGGLDHPTTNQRLYKIDSGKMVDITNLFHTFDRLN